jgi:hypothetical protein
MAGPWELMLRQPGRKWNAAPGIGEGDRRPDPTEAGSMQPDETESASSDRDAIERVWWRAQPEPGLPKKWRFSTRHVN